MVWSTGALSVFDPKTEKFTHIPEVPTSYGIALDQEGNAWFTELTPSGKVGKVDAKTLKVTKYTLPTQNGRPRRIEVDDKGIVWFAEFDGGKIGRLDPKTGRSPSSSCPARSRRPTRSASIATAWSGTRPNIWTWSAGSIPTPAR